MPLFPELLTPGAMIFTQAIIALPLVAGFTMVFQRPNLLNRSMQENISYGLELRRIKNLEKQVQTAMDRLGLTHLARQSTRSLSGGEAQRVALA